MPSAEIVIAQSPGFGMVAVIDGDEPVPLSLVVLFPLPALLPEQPPRPILASVTPIITAMIFMLGSRTGRPGDEIKKAY